MGRRRRVPASRGVGRWAPLVAVSKVLSAVFGTAVLWPVRAVVTLVIALRRRWLALSAWACTVVLSEAAIGPVKALVDRPRPPGALIATSGASYPSGHAIASAVTAIGVVMALTAGRAPAARHGRRGAGGDHGRVQPAVPGAHWLSDVVGGALIGAGLALAVPEAFEVARDRRRARAPAQRRGGGTPTSSVSRPPSSRPEAGAGDHVQRVVRAEVDPGDADGEREHDARRCGRPVPGTARAASRSRPR